MFQLDRVTMVLGSRVALRVDRLDLIGGELVGLIGANGSGKTTLLRLLAGLLKPSSGSLTSDGSRVAYVGQRQDQHAWMPLSVGEVLKMGRYRDRGLLGRLTAADKRLIGASAERLEISDLVDRSFGDLSGGQRQRVLIAGALVGDASCLLLDEPITGLDLPSQQIITDVARDEVDRGRLVMLSTHHLDEARTCDRVLALATAIIADGTPAEVLVPDTLAEAFGPRVLHVDSSVAGEGDVVVMDDHGHGHHH